MRVKMLMDYQGELSENTHFWAIGEVFDLPPGVAAALVAEGRAIYQASPTVSLSQTFNGALARLLIQNGFDSLDKVRSASDEDLLAVDGIGPKALRLIREQQGD